MSKVLAAELTAGQVGTWFPVPEASTTEEWLALLERHWGHLWPAPALDREGARAFQWPDDERGFKIFLVKEVEEDPPREGGDAMFPI